MSAPGRPKHEYRSAQHEGSPTSEQRQHDHVNDSLRPGGAAGPGDSPGSDAKLAEARTRLAQVYAAADAILDGIRMGDSQRFLDQSRQSGGE